MFPYLPEELERMIWEKYSIMYILPDIKKSYTVWLNPSDNLLNISKDIGAIQIKHTDLERILAKDHMKWYYENLYYQPCLINTCPKCFVDGFPCSKALRIGGFKEKILHNWKID